MRLKVLSAVALGSLISVATVKAAENENVGSEGSRELHQSMNAGMEKMHSMKMSGNTDADFVSMMIEHHRQAIDMSRVAIERGSNADVKTKAREIIAVSEKDISDLEKMKAQKPR
jgi:uncharacterized protein (DUF305 family)